MTAVKPTFQVDMDALVVALSGALGLVGGKIVDHGKRVAFIALSMADVLDLPPPLQEDLRHAALLHDAGVSKNSTHRKLIQLDWEGAKEHCRDGADLIAGFSGFSRVSEIILHHHEKWADLKKFGADKQIALTANLIFLADRVDVLVDWDMELILNRSRIENKIKDLGETFFHPDAVRAFMEVSGREVFWMSLYPRHLPHALSRFRPSTPARLDLDELENIAAIFSKIVDNKSPYTRDHSQGVALLCEHMGSAMKLGAQTVHKLRIAGLLHDLGKLAVPDEILDKPTALTAEEFQIIKRHPFETYYILSGLPALTQIRDWASFHHEKGDGSGYPFHLTDHDLGIEHMIVMLSDVIQALIQDRPYRVGLARDHVLDILAHLGARQASLKPLIDLVRQDYEFIAHLAKAESETLAAASSAP